MSGKGVLCARRSSQRQRDVSKGKEQPLKYTLTVEEALKEAGFK